MPAGRVCAQPDISVEATVDVNNVVLGAEINFAITIKGTKQVDQLILPDIEGFEKRYVGPFTNISIVNNSYTESVSHRYVLLPLKTGNFEIPALQVDINGQIYSTNPISVQVTDTATGGNPQQPVSLNDKIFIQLQMDDTDVYLNEPVIVKVFMFYSDIKVRDIQYPKMEHIGFIDEAYIQPKQYERVIEGRRFRIIEFSKVIYPTRTGELTVGPAQLQCSIVFRGKNRRNRSPFEDSFFGSIFESNESRPMVLTSLPVLINVKELPTAERPVDFSGAVGNYKFNATVSPGEVAVGDPITLKMFVEGQGNLKAINFPAVASEENFKVYDPLIQEEGQTKTLEQVLIPKSSSVREIPKIAFTYFDNETNKYQTVEKGPFPLKVNAVAQEGEFRVVGLQEQQPVIMSQEKLGEDIVFIKDSPGRFRARGQRIYMNWIYYAVLVFLGMLYLGGYLLYRITHRMETDQSFARRRHASKFAQTELKVLKSMIGEKRAAEFYDHLFKFVQQYIAHKLHLPAGKTTIKDIHEKLKSYQVDKDIFDDIVRVYDECDAIRYASRSIHE
ncbi:MAG: BatD family protein, partial [Candidatus Omnitrophica bacterium]|nr:BatD family protein [Candidatus Omnitrophota bacterium]